MPSFYLAGAADGSVGIALRNGDVVDLPSPLIVSRKTAIPAPAGMTLVLYKFIMSA
jgi:hypothetical protein